MSQLTLQPDLAGPKAATRHAPPVRRALVALSLSTLLASLGMSIANIALPELAEAFAAGFTEVQWVVLAYLLAITVLIVSVGRLGDLVGRRRLLLAGIVLFTAFSLLAGIAPTLGLLIAARAAQGLGAAILMALTLAFVAGTVPKERTGSAMGLLGTMSAIGTALGPSLGGVLIASLGWRSIFLINLPLGLLTFLLAQRSLPADQPRPRHEPIRFDVAGTLLLGLSLAGYALAMTLGRGDFGPLNLALLLAALAGAALFVRTEMEAPSPLIRLPLFGNRVLSAGLAMNLLVMTVMMTTLVVGPFYLARGLGLDAALVGLSVSVGPVVAALTGVPAGRLVDRWGAARIILAGLVLIAGGATALSLMPAAAGIPGYIVPLACMTSGYGLFQAASNTAVMASIPGDQRGVISGLLNLSRNLGLITGASLMGAVFAWGAADDIATASPGMLEAGLHLTFAVAAALIVVAMAIAVAGGLVLAGGPNERRDAGSAERSSAG